MPRPWNPKRAIEITVLAMFHPREDFPLRRPVAFELVGEDHAGHVGEPLEEFTEELLGSPLVAPTLHEDIKHIPILINGTPQIVLLPIDFEKDFIQMPPVADFAITAFQLIGIPLAEFLALLTDGFG